MRTKRRHGTASRLMAILAVAAGSACGEAAPPVAAFDPAMPPQEPAAAMLTSAAGTWTVSMWTAPQPPRKGIVEVLFRISDSAGGFVDGLALDVVPWMPAHGHGGTSAAPVTARSDGWYLVSPAYLYMSGRWELRSTVQGFPDDGFVPVIDVP